jgi:mannosyltransferase OCH1-like enzyme
MYNKKLVYLIFILSVFLLFFYSFFLDISSSNETFINNINNIPKIIHQTAPRDKSKWKEEWHSCQQTWKDLFPESEYKHVMWNDDDLENLISNDFPWYYDIYKSYKKNIQRIDIARYFILYKYGGIYADMDYMCMKNFYDTLPSNKVSISESPYQHINTLKLYKMH